MCGIVGIVEQRGPDVDPKRMRTVTSSLAHRGPDDEGIFVDGRVGLGHRRLSILDPSPLGHQPMANDDEDVWIVYNGEVYNFREIRESLGDRRPFRSNTDTEVILRAYEEYGERFVEHLRGIFALAIYDRRSGQLLLARDRFGIKPLYYVIDDDHFIFASEFKPLIAAGLKPECDPLAALDWVFSGWTDDGKCMLKGVHRLPPGGMLRYDTRTGACREDRYYAPADRFAELEQIHDSMDGCANRLDDELSGAVSRQLVSDVPVGTFCSGGVDSSLVTAMASKRQPDIVAYNVAVPDCADSDESSYARAVARHLNVRLATFEMTRDEFRRHAVRTIYHVEYPLSFENAVPLSLVSKMAYNDGVRVLLSGEGADELFGGYVNQYRGLAIRKLIHSRGRLVGGMLKFAINAATKLVRKATGHQPSSGRSLGLHEILCGGLRRRELAEEVVRSTSVLSDPIDQELAAEWLTELQTYLLPILHRTDRASMMASVEARVPFLDEGVVDLAYRLPPSVKLRTRGFGVDGKAVLKRVASRYLPRDIVYRPKMGFHVPVEYHHGDIPRSWLVEGFVPTTFGLEEKRLRHWLDSLTGRSRWMYLALEIWGQLFIQQRPVSDVEADYLGMPARHPVCA